MVSEGSTSPRAWTCSACTWSNDNALGRTCVMCGTIRPLVSELREVLGPSTRSSRSISQMSHNNVESSARTFLDQSIGYEVKVSDCSSRSEDKCEKWDAFAALESNYQSSDYSGEESSDESENSNISDHTHSVHNEVKLEASNFMKCAQRNDERRCTKQDVNSGDQITEITLYDLTDTSQSTKEKIRLESMNKCNDVFRYIDLVDSEEENNCTLRDEIFVKNVAPCVKSKLKADCVNENLKPSMSQMKRRQSLLSSSRCLESIRQPLKQTFPCMNDRNDIKGGSGSGINGVHVCRQIVDEISSDEDFSPKNASRSKLPKQTNAKKTIPEPLIHKKNLNASMKSVTGGSSSSKREKSQSKRFKRRSGRHGTIRKKRFKSFAKRKSNGSSDPKQRIQKSCISNKGHAPYMSIVKQEPALRHIGGASITF